MTADQPPGYRGDGRRTIWQFLAAFGLITTVAAVVVIQIFGDRWWPTIPLLYGPRWLLAVMPALTLPLVLRAPRTGIIVAVVAFGAFALGVLDLRTGAVQTDAGGGHSVRVMEFNMGGAAADRAALARELDQLEVDAAFLVECPAAAGQEIATRLRWHVETTGTLCLLSPHQIRNWASRDQMEFWRRNGSGAVARAEIMSPVGTLRVGIVHLATPRDALEMMRDLSEIPSRGPVMTANRLLRDDESRAARAWIGGPAETAIIAGDFNLPIESAIYRRHWGDFANAFSRAGAGLGHTKLIRWFGVRIDHILTGGGVRAVRTTLGPALGSDHRIVVADLIVERRFSEPRSPDTR